MANTVTSIHENLKEFKSLCSKYGFYAIHSICFCNPGEYLDSSGLLKREFDYYVVVAYQGIFVFSVDIGLFLSPDWPALEALIIENAMKRSFCE